MFDSASTAVLFPGQGSQTETMRDDVERFLPDLLELADRELGEDLFERVTDGTRFAQPSIYLASLAGWKRLGRPHLAAFAGHSLGEFAALAAAGALSGEDGLRLVALRGRLMDKAAELTGDGGMLALLGAGAAEHAASIAERSGLVVANDNSPGQVVLSGSVHRLNDGAREANAVGLMARRLDVAGAFHSPAMAPAVPAFRAALAATAFAEPGMQVISSVTTKPVRDPRKDLLAGLTEPVRWRETLLALHDCGVRRFIDVGPGKVLAGLAKRTLSEVTVDSATALEATRV
jgi:[acyl-carrier-protein] S-malonyltransferase